MPYCSQCGVEVDEAVEKCPLCQTPIQKILPPGSPDPYPPRPAGSPPVPPLSIGEKMAIARTISTIGILIPVLFVITIDFFVDKRISWSSYVAASLAAAWFITMVSLFSWKRPYVLTSLIHLDLLIFIFSISRISGRTEWFVPVALPLVVCSCLVIILAVSRIRRMRKKGANVAAVILLVISLLCAAIDLSLGLYFRSDVRLGWSIVVFSVMIPTSLLLFYVQSPRFSHSRLRRFLHF